VSAERSDTAARRLLASLYHRKGESLAASDRRAAIDVLQKSVRLDPAAPRVAALLRQLRKAGAAARTPSTMNAAAPQRIEGKPVR